MDSNVIFLDNSKQMWHYNLNKKVWSIPLQQVIQLTHPIIDTFSQHLCLSQTLYNFFFLGNLYFLCFWISALSGWKDLRLGWKDLKIGFKLDRKYLPMLPKSRGALIRKIYFSDKKDDILQVKVCQSSTKVLE